MPEALATPLPTDPLVLRYLEHVRVEKRLAARTHTLYTLDLERLSQFAAGVNVPLLQLQTAHIRRFVAQMHSGGALRSFSRAGVVFSSGPPARG